jgi:hypothetical protein
MSDLLKHESVTVLPTETPAGTVEVLAPPIIVDGERPALGRVPALGEHDLSLRQEFLPPTQ